MVRRRTVLVGVGVLVAVLVAAVAFAAGKSDGGRDGASSTVAAAPARPAPEFAPDDRRMDGDGGGSGKTDVQGAPEPALGMPSAGTQRSLVRSAQLTVEVADPVVAVREVRTAVMVVGGFVAEEQSEGRSSWVVLRVPAEALDRFLDQVAGFGRVTSRSSQVVDTTDEVVDLDARVASQTASVARVRGLLAQATSIGDVVAIESELASREAELDSLTRRLAALRDQVAMSTVAVDLRAPGAAPSGPRPAPGFLEGLAAGWEGLRSLGTAVAALVGLVLPFVPVVALLGGAVWLARRAVRGRRVPATAGADGRTGPASDGEP